MESSMKKYLLLKSLSVSYGLLVFFLVNIFWVATCLEAIAEPEMPSLRYINEDDTDGQVLEFPLPI